MTEPFIKRSVSSDSATSSHGNTDDITVNALTTVTGGQHTRTTGTSTTTGSNARLPWQNSRMNLKHRQSHQRYDDELKNINVNEIDENTLMPMQQNRSKPYRTDNTKKISKYNTHMNNFYHAEYPPKGLISTATNPRKNKPIDDHPVFVTAKQLLNLTIGNFRKHDTSTNDSIASVDPNTHHQQQHGQYNNNTSNNNHPSPSPPFATLDHFQISYNAVQFLLYDRNMCPNNHVRAINAAFAVIERLIREISYTKTYNQNIKYILDTPIQFRLLMHYWKSSALLGGHVLPAIEMFKKIQWMMIELQRIPKEQCPIMFDKHIVSMLLQVMIKQLPKQHAPLAAESFMDVIYEAIDATSADDDDEQDRINTEIHPDSVIYVQLLNTWMDSELPQTAFKIDALLDDMKIRDIPLDNAIYSTLIRYWGNKGSLTRIRAILERMEHENVTPNVACLGQAIYGYTRSKQPLQAVSLLEQMHTKTTGTTQDIMTITACTLNILDAFKRLIIRGNDVNRNVLRAEDIVRRYETNSMLKSRSDDRIHGAMMDIYAHVGRIDDVERMMQTINAGDPAKYSILIRAYGKIDRANLAMEVVFERMMKDPNNAAPTSHIFKSLIEAWIGSSQSDAIEQAYSVLHRMDGNELCRQNNLRPDSFMYGAQLKVVGASKRSDSGEKVIEILDDMVKRSESTNDKGLIPNLIIYNLALNACYQSSMDMDSAEVVLQRMELSDTPPDLRLYNETLNNYSIIGTLASAERAEQLLEHIIEMSNTNEMLKPNVFSYNTIVNAWVASEHESAREKVWRIYERMQEANVLPNMATFNAMISFLTKPTNELVDVQRADKLLDLMESGTIAGVSPDRRHYGPLMNGWIFIGDIKKAADVLLRRVMTYINKTGKDKERCLPTPDHYYLVANGWIRLDELVQATEFFEQIQTLHDKKHIPEGPDLYSYLTLHSAWTRSTHPEAQRYLEKLDKIIGKAG